MTKREMGLFWFFFFLEKLLVWVCAHVHCFTLVLDCATLVIQRKMGVIRNEKEYREEIVIKIRIFVL